VRIIVIDDHPSQRDGRVLWLSRIAGVEVTGMTFEEAAALGEGWQAVQIAVLDGHDRRSLAHRAQAAAAAGVAPLPPHDNFVGVRVATEIRKHCTSQQTRITLISAYARDNDLRSRRIAQAGIDYVFEHYEADKDEETFVRAVLHPETFPSRDRPVDWAAHGYTTEPDVASAITIVEESPAGYLLLADGPGNSSRGLEWAFRTMRGRLYKALRGGVSPGAGTRQPRAPRKGWLVEQLRQAFGKDLPVDPR
jgi:hypothetical protein